jgi:hypothetical protein
LHRFGSRGRWCRSLLNSSGGGGFDGLSLIDLVALNGLLLQESEDVVENEVAIWLFGEEEGLDELAPRFICVGHLTDDLDNDPAICRRLGIDGVYEDFAILEANRSDFLVDFLLTKARLNLLSLGSVDEGRVLVVEAVEAVGLFVDKGVVLGHKLPSHF